MKRCFKYMCVFTTSLLLGAGSLLAGGSLILRGRITDVQGKPVAGAQVDLTDPVGKVKYRVLSDVRGVYRFPLMPDWVSYRVTVSHVRFKPLRVDDVMAEARFSVPGLETLPLGQPVALLASTQIASRDFLLTPAAATPQSLAGPVDPNLYEYYYQQGLLLLGENRKREAVEYLKAYAQGGSNPTQVARSLVLIAENEGN